MNRNLAGFWLVYVAQLKRAVDLLIFLSVALGVVLLVQIYKLVHNWLFYSVLTGWFAYLLVAIVALTGRKIAYPFASILSILTLAVSLPQPVHFSFASAGMWLATFTFAAGQALQIALLILIPIYWSKGKNPQAQAMITNKR
jgi:hypothetical protein